MNAMSKKYKTQNNWIVDFPQSVSNPKYQSKKREDGPRVLYTQCNSINIFIKSAFFITFFLFNLLWSVL